MSRVLHRGERLRYPAADPLSPLCRTWGEGADLQRLPVEDVGGAVERVKRTLEGRQHGIGDGLRAPPAILVSDADRARLAHQEYLVLAHGEDLPRHVLGEVARQEH